VSIERFQTKSDGKWHETLSRRECRELLTRPTTEDRIYHCKQCYRPATGVKLPTTAFAKLAIYCRLHLPPPTP
jgi:hypothetical protein